MSPTPSLCAAESFNAAALREGWPAICDHTLKFDSSNLADLLSIWSRFALEGCTPSRGQLSPQTLKPLLRSIVIYERVQDGTCVRRYRVRLVGSSMAAVIGDLTGKFLDDVVPESFLPRWHACLDATLSARHPLRFLTRSDTNHMEFLVGEYFSAPMLAADGSESMILGGSHFDGRRPWATVEREARAALAAING
jgi:hypothetical protein